MPYHLELGSDGHKFHDKAIVVNSQTGQHHSNHPISMAKAQRQMQILENYDKNKINKVERPPSFNEWIKTTHFYKVALDGWTASSFSSVEHMKSNFREALKLIDTRHPNSYKYFFPIDEIIRELPNNKAAAIKYRSKIKDLLFEAYKEGALKKQIKVEETE
jgi:hypothetical protein